jgi:hypothetical protein
VNFPIQITVVDPFESSLKTGQERAEQVLVPASKVELLFEVDLKKINDSFDLAIIATNSDTRFQVFKTLVSQSKVKHVLFEKFLFQTENAYLETEVLLNKHDIKAWVNCSRRMFPGYQKWISEWKQKGTFEYKVEGGAWGLACNMVHHIDFYQFISGEKIQEINFSKLDSLPVESKRKGFFEFFGELEVLMDKGGRIKLIAKQTSKPPITSLKFKDQDVVLDEVNGYIKTGLVNEKVAIPFQSELTQIIALSIVEKKPVLLPSFDEAKDYHLKLLSGFLKFSNKHDLFMDGILPIT